MGRKVWRVIGGGAGVSSGGTATQWTLAWTSIPAAWRWVTCKGSCDGGWRSLFWMRGVMAASKVKEKCKNGRAASAGDR